MDKTGTSRRDIPYAELKVKLGMSPFQIPLVRILMRKWTSGAPNFEILQKCASLQVWAKFASLQTCTKFAFRLHQHSVSHAAPAASLSRHTVYPKHRATPPAPGSISDTAARSEGELGLQPCPAHTPSTRQRRHRVIPCRAHTRCPCPSVHAARHCSGGGGVAVVVAVAVVAVAVCG